MKQVALKMLTASLDSDREPFHEESLLLFQRVVFSTERRYSEVSQSNVIIHKRRDIQSLCFP